MLSAVKAIKSAASESKLTHCVLSRSSWPSITPSASPALRTPSMTLQARHTVVPAAAPPTPPPVAPSAPASASTAASSLRTAPACVSLATFTTTRRTPRRRMGTAQRIVSRWWTWDAQRPRPDWPAPEPAWAPAAWTARRRALSAVLALWMCPWAGGCCPGAVALNAGC